MGALWPKAKKHAASRARAFLGCTAACTTGQQQMWPSVQGTGLSRTTSPKRNEMEQGAAEGAEAVCGWQVGQSDWCVKAILILTCIGDLTTHTTRAHTTPCCSQCRQFVSRVITATRR